jgi:uncharacterized membrane protein
MKTFFAAYAFGGVAFLVIDIAWLSTMGRIFYRPALGSMLLEKFNPVPALAFYLLYVVGIVVFAIGPALQAGSVTAAFGYGLLFGLCSYATYDLSNLATLKGWPISVTLVDMGWGGLATGIAAALGCWGVQLLTGAH